MQQLDQRLRNTPFAVGHESLIKVLRGFSNNRDHSTAEQLFQGLPVHGMLGTTSA